MSSRFERAEAQRLTMTARALAFFEEYDLLLMPATVVAPFPIENRYVAECNGTSSPNYCRMAGHRLCDHAGRAARRYRCRAASRARICRSDCRSRAAARRGARSAGAKGLEDILGLRGTTPIDPRTPK